MERLLRYTQHIQTHFSKKIYEVNQLLGIGGQGEVYQANAGGELFALKWFYPHCATMSKWETLEMLIKRGVPNPENNRFLWPLDLAVSPDVQGFGYIMLLRDEKYHGLIDLMKRRVSITFRNLCTAGFNLADSYFQLHSRGLCYQDISFGNVFFDPDNGNVLICDNDNITLEGDSNISVLGTSRFMAPEIIRKEALPSIQTDIYSLAVLLFYIFMFHHPLEGMKEHAIHILDNSAMTKIYGIEPLFIFDPNDHSNEPVPGYQDNALVFWPLYPQFLRDRFVQAFTEGLKDPIHGRVREDEWSATFVRLRDSIFYCSSCGTQNFYDDTFQEQLRKDHSCWACKRGVLPPPRLIIQSSAMMLNHDTKLYPHHIDNRRMYNFSSPVAEVTHHSVKPGVWGLKNLSDERWSFVRADGTSGELDVGKSIAIVPGTKLFFGNIVGEIQF